MTDTEWGTGFAMVPGWLLARQPSGTAILAYTHLAMFGTFNPGSARYEQCRPSASTLAHGDPSRGYPGMGCSVKTVRRALEELENLGAIVGEEAYDVRGARLPNVYRLQFGSVAPPLVTGDQGGWSPVTRGGGHQCPGGVVTSDHQPITQYPKPNIQTPPPSSSVDLSPTRASAATEEEMPSAKDNPPSAEAVALVRALPSIHGDRPSGRLASLISDRLAQGWTAEALRRELIRDLSTARGTGVYHARLASLPDVPPTSVPMPRPEPTTKPVVDHTKRVVRRCEHGRVAVNCPKCRDMALNATETPPESVVEPQTAHSGTPSMDPRLSQLLSAVAATSSRR